LCLFGYADSYLLRSLVGFLHFEGHPLKYASGSLYDLREAKLELGFALFLIQKLGISDVLVMSSFKAQHPRVVPEQGDISRHDDQAYDPGINLLLDTGILWLV
jgi:hypothetical protein